MTYESFDIRVYREFILKIAREKFIDKTSTMDIMLAATNYRERILISIVSLCDVSEDLRYFGMSDDEIKISRLCYSLLKRNGFSKP